MFVLVGTLAPLVVVLVLVGMLAAAVGMLLVVHKGLLPRGPRSLQVVLPRMPLVQLMGVVRTPAAAPVRKRRVAGCVEKERGWAGG